MILFTAWTEMWVYGRELEHSLYSCHSLCARVEMSPVQTPQTVVSALCNYWIIHLRKYSGVLSGISNIIRHYLHWVLYAHILFLLCLVNLSVCSICSVLIISLTCCIFHSAAEHLYCDLHRPRSDSWRISDSETKLCERKIGRMFF